MKNLVLAAMAAVLATGCTGGAQVRQSAMAAQERVALAYLQQQQIAAATPLCRLECPPAGCQISAMECHAPTEIKAPVINMPESTAKYWAGMIERVTIGVAGIAAPAYLAAEGFRAMQGLAGAVSGPTTTTTTETTTTISDSHNQTGLDPTVVTQPAPIVVQQPAPLVVTQPAPLVVDPVVVQQTDRDHSRETTTTQSPPVVVTQPAPAIVTQPEPIVVRPEVLTTPPAQIIYTPQ